MCGDQTECGFAFIIMCNVIIYFVKLMGEGVCAEGYRCVWRSDRVWVLFHNYVQYNILFLKLISYRTIMCIVQCILIILCVIIVNNFDVLRL